MSRKKSSKQTPLGGESDTYVVHLTEEGCQECSSNGTIKLDTHMVHLQKKVVKNGHFLKYYQVRHPRGAPYRRRSSRMLLFWNYQVRHPWGASTEEDRQERSSSKYYQVRHSHGASTEKGRQGWILSSETTKIDPHVVHLLEIIKSVTHVVHLPEEGHQGWIPSSKITKLDTQGVYLLKIIKSVTHGIRL